MNVAHDDTGNSRVHYSAVFKGPDVAAQHSRTLLFMEKLDVFLLLPIMDFQYMLEYVTEYKRNIIVIPSFYNPFKLVLKEKCVIRTDLTVLYLKTRRNSNDFCSKLVKAFRNYQ